jgi:thiol:disulfide interchange protein
MLQAFGRSGVPLYVLFPGGQLDAPIVLPELISEEIVLEALSRAAALRVSP